MNEIIDCLIQGPAEEKYSENVRAFALTLHFHSPRAYEFVRKRFNDHLPHTSTIRKWYSVSKSSGKPGFCEDSLLALKNMADNMKAQDVQLMVSLNFDEMATRKHVQWSDPEKKILGNITYGFRPDDAKFTVATNAIVFMINGVNVDFNLPIAFHFIQNLKAGERATLLKEVLTKITELNIKVISVIFDGLGTNIAMCKQMGASFELKDFRPYFNFPSNNDKTYIILDASHMIKLVRNTLARNKILYDGDNSKIQWKYIEELEKFRNESGYILTHKLNKKHIQWFRAPMNVRLAVETISNSVADAMEFLMKKGKKEFLNCSATVKFIRFFNNIFDVLNTKSIQSNSLYKSSITPSNHTRIFSFFDDAIEYIRALQTEPDGQMLLTTKSRTAYRGLIIDMENMKNIFRDVTDSKLMDSLSTFRFSQDPLEGLFGRIRSLNGCNDNPSVQQFCGAFRKVVLNTEINCSSLSNCVDSLNILTVSSGSSVQDKTKDVFGVKEYLEYIERSDIVHRVSTCDFMFDALEECSIAYIAGKIERKIETARFTCEKCENIFASNEHILTSFDPAKVNTTCKNTFEICAIADKHLEATVCKLDFSYDSLLDNILHDISYENMYPATNFDGHVEHKFFFILNIVEEYIRTRATYIAKEATLNEQTKMLRNKLKKLVHAYGQ